MKKLVSIVLSLTVMILMAGTTYAQENKNFDAKAHKQKFEQRLNLTEKQKEKAKQIHQKGFEEMKPIMVKIKTKREEINAIKNSTTDETAKQEQLSKKYEELKTLENQAREIRKKNSKEFESILNKKQKKELEQMKLEGRKRFERNHPPRPPFERMQNFKGFEFRNSGSIPKILPVMPAPEKVSE